MSAGVGNLNYLILAIIVGRRIVEYKSRFGTAVIASPLPPNDHCELLDEYEYSPINVVLQHLYIGHMCTEIGLLFT